MRARDFFVFLYGQILKAVQATFIVILFHEEVKNRSKISLSELI